jgi:hypothetical protein
VNRSRGASPVWLNEAVYAPGRNRTRLLIGTFSALRWHRGRHLTSTRVHRERWWQPTNAPTSAQIALRRVPTEQGADDRCGVYRKQVGRDCQQFALDRVGHPTDLDED